MPECRVKFRVLDESRDLKFSYREIKFSKINIPKRHYTNQHYYYCLLAELTQDVASRGLGVVYESCSSEQKQSLVTALVDTLMTGKRSQYVTNCHSNYMMKQENTATYYY